MGDRTVRPRLSGQWTWVSCPEVVCNPPASATGSCEIGIRDHQEALQHLGTACTDAAVDFLVRERSKVPSDVAGAWYVSALQHDRPHNLFRAYEAVLAAPASVNASFNRALIEEALGLPPSWDKVPVSELGSDWATDVQAGAARAPRVEAAAQWADARKRLPAVLRARDVATAQKLIAPFPGPAQQYLEQDLPLSDAVSAHTLAQALFRVTKDPFSLHIAQAWQQSVEGVAEYRAARAAEALHRESASLFRRAIPPLTRAGNPLHLSARMRAALHSGVQPPEDCRREAERHRYRRLLGDLHSARGFIIGFESAFPNALAAYESSASAYLSAGDRDSAAGSLARRAGVAREAGHTASALRDILRALQYGPHVVTPKELQNVYGEAGKIALELGHPELALAFHNVVINSYERAVRRLTPAETEKLRTEISIAYTHRAEIHAARNRADLAADDLKTARAAAAPEIPVVARLVAMRQYEVEGRLFMNSAPGRAAELFTRALEQTPDFHTYRAWLFVHRANAYQLARQPDKAAEDLRRAIAEINQEEDEILSERLIGENEGFWPGYFARFLETYRLLVELLIEKGDLAAAFDYAERARAYETLDLLRKRSERPYRPRKLDDIRKVLPADTALLEYSVLNDRAYVLIVTRGVPRFEKIPVERAALAEWSESIIQAGSDRNVRRFNDLIARPPAQLVPSLSGVKRLVIVADEPLHNVPFAALRNPVTGNFVVQDYVLETAPSATLYVTAVERDRELSAVSNPSVLAVGNPLFDATLPVAAGLRKLTHAGPEAEAIAALYTPHVKTLIGAEATVDAFFRHAAGKDILHFAGHGIVNPPALLLASSENHSGALYTEDLLTRLKFDRTRLVVLSACSTAGGLPIGPEGVAPLVRPIITAGVPAVIGSLWNVNDATGKRLLVSFHVNYRKSGDAAAALRLAQLELLDSSDSAAKSGASWALFQVIGHNAPTSENDKGEPP